MSFRINSIKSYLPKKKETLESLSSRHFNKKKLLLATGINDRFISSENENVITLSIKSAKKILNTKIKKQLGFLFFDFDQFGSFKLLLLMILELN